MSSLKKAPDFLDVVTEFKELVENKSTDSVSNQKKAKAWMEIAAAFSSNTGVMKRDANQLKNLHF